MNTFIKSKVFRVFAHILLLTGVITMILPFVYMICLSFMTDKQIFSGGVSFIPAPFTVENYFYVVKNSDIFRYFFNSMVVALLTTLGQVIISAMAGYAFARFTFKYKEVLFFLIIVSMMIPSQVNIVPLFFIMKQLNWINTYYALIVPGLFGGFGVFMMCQYFKSMPKDIETAAKIDGCNEFEVFYKIAIPLALPCLITLAIFTFIGSWNSFMWPLIVTHSETMRTLPLGLAEFKGSFREMTDWGALCAYSAVCSVPVISVFILGRKYLINDILNGGIKE